MAISEACKFEIKEEVDQMVDRGDAATRSQAFDAMVEFYRTIGIEIKKSTVERKYYRASELTNVSKTENPTAPSDSEEIKQIKQPAKDGTMRGGPRPGSGRKKKTNKKGQPARKEKIKVADYDLGSLPMRYARMAVLDLEKIETDHPDTNHAFDYVIEWISRARGI